MINQFSNHMHTKMCEKIKKFKSKFFYIEKWNYTIVTRCCNIFALINTIKSQGEKICLKKQKN